MNINTLNILVKNNHFQLLCDYNDNISVNVGTEIIIQSDNKVIKRKASDIYEKNALSSAKRKKSNVENISNCKSSFDNVDKIVCDANVDLLNKINDPIEKK